MLVVLLRKLETLFIDQPYLLVTYQALFSTAYFGLLRVGELTSGTHPILAKDVHIADNKDKILFVLRYSKTHDQTQHPQMVKISSRKLSRQSSANKKCLDSNYCPYRLSRNYIKIRGPYSTHNLQEPFFVFSDHSPITPYAM